MNRMVEVENTLYKNEARDGYVACREKIRFIAPPTSEERF